METESGQRSILIVEDDEAIAAGVALNLKLEGFITRVATDGELALRELMQDPPDLVLLDISLPRRNGLEVLSTAREAGNNTPIIVLSARQDEADKVAALKLGADDYVTKPFGVAELLARIEALLRRMEHRSVPQDSPEPRAELRFGEIEIDVGTRQVLRGGEDVPLTHLEFELLTFLVQNPERAFTRQDLLREVWSIERRGMPRTVDNFVAQLRAKLEADPNHPRHLVTVRGTGYRFVP